MTISPYASPAQLAAHSRLLSAVAAAVDAGQRVPCLAEPDVWVSDDPADTEAAAQGCLGCCSALDACRRYIEQHHEAAGVWAGSTSAARNPRRKPGPRPRGTSDA